MIKGGQRIATATGVMLADPHSLGNAQLGASEALFDPDFWAARGEAAATSGGRGSAWFVGSAAHPWVLRHYRRGGFVARISEDRYWWSGEDRVRSFSEWRLLHYLSERGLDVPKPVAAFYRRERWTYRCDLITERILQAQPMSAALEVGALAAPVWRAVGAAVARLHRHGVDHADLNAHNILLDTSGVVQPKMKGCAGASSLLARCGLAPHWAVADHLSPSKCMSWGVVGNGTSSCAVTVSAGRAARLLPRASPTSRS